MDDAKDLINIFNLQSIPSNQCDYWNRQRQIRNWVGRGMHLLLWHTVKQEPPELQKHQLEQMQQYAALLPRGRR